MRNYEADAGKLANALRQMLHLHKFSTQHLSNANYLEVCRARDSLWEFDNGAELDKEKLRKATG